MQDKLIIGALLTFFLCFGIERGCRAMFPVPISPVILERKRQIELESFTGDFPPFLALEREMLGRWEVRVGGGGNASALSFAASVADCCVVAIYQYTSLQTCRCLGHLRHLGERISRHAAIKVVRSV